MNEYFKALILGGGFSGLAIANAFQNADIDFRICDKDLSLRETYHGNILWQNGLKGLEDLGCDMSGFNPITKYKMFNSDGSELETISLKGKVCTTSKKALNNALINKLNSKYLLSGYHYYTFKDETPKGYKISFHDKEDLKGELIVAADGILSIIREKYKKEGKPKYAGYTHWKGVLFNYSNPDLQKDTIYDFIGESKRFIIYHIGEGNFAWFVYSFESLKYQHITLNRKKKLNSFFKDWDSRIMNWINASDDSTIDKNASYFRDITSSWGNKNLLYFGDALYPVQPMFNQAINFSLELSGFIQKALLNKETDLKGLSNYIETNYLKRLEKIAESSTHYAEFPIQQSLISSLFSKSNTKKRIVKAIESTNQKS